VCGPLPTALRERVVRSGCARSDGVWRTRRGDKGRWVAVAGMAAAGADILRDDALLARMAAAGRAAAHARFSTEKVVPMYESYYDRILGS